MRAITTVLIALLWGATIADAHDLRSAIDPARLPEPQISSAQLLALVGSAASEDQRYIYQRSLLWTPGKPLSACFMPGSTEAMGRSAVVDAAAALIATSGANLAIDFGQAPFRTCSAGANGVFPEDIRVSLTDGCCSAYVGRASHATAIGKVASVYVQGPPARHTILHELIHALGFQHEHQKPGSPCDFDVQAMADTWGWSVEEVRANVSKLDGGSNKFAFSTTFDRNSIMKYFFDAGFLKGGENSPCFSPENTKLSNDDILGLRTAYPVAFNMAAHKSRVQSARGLALSSELPQSFRDAVRSLPDDVP